MNHKIPSLPLVTETAHLKCFAPASAIVCKDLLCITFWLSIFCAPALFDCAYDMDYASEIEYHCYRYFFRSFTIINDQKQRSCQSLIKK